MFITKRPQGQSGSIAILMPVIVITTGLVLATVFAVESGQRSSRRAGDSANALQVADAGVNAAVQFLPTVPSTQTTVGPLSATVGNGTYTYTATKMSNLLWNIDSLGVDQTGLKRRLNAQAVGAPLFGRPILIRNTGTFAAGAILDSFSDTFNRCTKNGLLTVINPGSVTYPNMSSSTQQANCQGDTDSTWIYSNDGCEIPSEEAEMADPIPNQANITGPAKCPPLNTKRVTPKYPAGTVGAPKTWHVPCSAATCQAPSPKGATYTCQALSGTDKGPLQGGKTYYYETIILLDGCIIQNSASGPAKLFATNVTIGKDTGPQNNIINPPQSPCLPFLATVPATGYCANWANNLQINIIGSGEVRFKNKSRYVWGVINAPAASVFLETTQLEFWGASISDSMTSSAQFNWHFDDNLLNELGSGFYSVENWREEGQS